MKFFKNLNKSCSNSFFEFFIEDESRDPKHKKRDRVKNELGGEFDLQPAFWTQGESVVTLESSGGNGLSR